MTPAQLAALERWLTHAAAAERVTISDAALLSGGAIQQNWRLQARVQDGDHAGEACWVLRTDAPSAVAASHGRSQEFALLQAAHGAGVTVPSPLGLCDDPAVIGRPFFVMRCVEGTAAGHLLTRDDGPVTDRAQLAQRLGHELALIHSIRPPRPDLDFLAISDELPALRAIRLLRRDLDRLPTAHPALEWGLRWLERQAPARGDIVLCHGDYRTGNYLVDAQGGLTGILDWEFAGWGDPLQDIGWFCARCWRFGADGREAGGIGQRADFYRGYERTSGRALDAAQVRYWELMAHVRWAVIALAQAQRHASGEETSLLLALTGRIVPELEHEVLTMTEPADA